MRNLRKGETIVRTLNEGLDFLFVPSCSICGKPSCSLSELKALYSSLEKVSEFASVMGECGKECPGETINGFHICKKCISQFIPFENERRWLTLLSEPYKGDPYPGLVLYVPFSYSGPSVNAIRQMKFSGKTGIGLFLGLLLGQCLIESDVAFDTVIPVPLSLERFKERGYNQAGLISCSISCMLKIPFCSDALFRKKATLRQSELADNLSRSANVSGAFFVSEDNDLAGKTVLLIDDVATTGCTLHEAAGVLLDSGVKNVLCCAFAGNRIVKNGEPY